MKVLHLSSETSWRGGEQQIAYLIQELSKQKVNSIVACQQGSAFEAYCQKQNIPYHSFPFRNSLDISTALSIKQLCEKENITIAHLHSSKSHGIGWLAGLMGNKTPLLLSRRVDFSPKANFLTKQKYNYKRIKRILCVSEAIRQIMLLHIWQKEKCHVVYDGIDLNRFKNSVPTGSLRSRFGIPRTQSLIGNVSAIAPHKDYFTFVNTAAELLRRGVNAKFLIIGTGPDEDQVKAYVQQKGLQEDILFTGFLNNIPEVFPELDIFLMTSKTEGLGTTLLDAFACKVPVVATEAGGIPEIVRNGLSGLTAPPEDARGLASAVEKIILDKTLREQLITNAFELVKSFDKQSMALQTLTHYQQVLATEA